MTDLDKGINGKKGPLLPPVPTHVRGIATGTPATVYFDGIPSCNLLDHRVTAGCTAVVALKKGNKLYVANAGNKDFFSVLFLVLFLLGPCYDAMYGIGIVSHDN